MSAGGIRLYGDTALMRKLKTLEPRVFAKVVFHANKRAMGPVLKMARAKVAVRFGILKKSLGIKTKKYPKKGLIFTVVGPRAGFKQPAGTEVKKKSRRDSGRIVSRGTKKLTRNVDPRFYAHLVEGGHKTKGGTIVPGRPFLRPAFEQIKPGMIARYKADLAAGIVREAKKGP